MSESNRQCVIEAGTSLPDIIRIAEGMGIDVEGVLARTICDHGRWRNLQDSLAAKVVDAIGDNIWSIYDWEDQYCKGIALEVHNHPCEIDYDGQYYEPCGTENPDELELKRIANQLIQLDLNIDSDPFLKNTIIICDPPVDLLDDLRDIKHIRHTL